MKKKIFDNRIILINEGIVHNILIDLLIAIFIYVNSSHCSINTIHQFKDKLII
jgi:hypothetical protein